MNQKELLRRIDELETAGMKQTAEFYSVFQEGLRYFFSEQDMGYRKNKDWDYVVLNYIWPSTMQEIAKLAKNNPKIIGLPRGDDDTESAEVWEGATRWQWQTKLRMRLKQILEIFDGKICGYSVSRIYWDTRDHWSPEQRQWLGDVRYRLWHPQAFWANSEEDINEGDCGSVRYVPLDWAIQHWPSKKADLEAVAEESKEEEFLNFGDEKFRSAISGGVLVETDDEEGQLKKVSNTIADIVLRSGNLDTDRVVKMVRISETFMKDYSESKQKETQPVPPEKLIEQGLVRIDEMRRLIDTKTGLPYAPEEWPTEVVAEWDEPKFPTGRYLLSVGEGEGRVLLNPKEEEQVWPFSIWPFVIKPHYPLPHMWQGSNAVSMYKSCQDTINIAASHLLNNLKQFGDPKVVVEDGAIAINAKTKQPFRLGSSAGAVWRMVKGRLNAIRTDPPIPPSPAAMAVYNMFVQEYKNFSGLQNVAQGIQSSGKATATEMNYLMISSNDRIFLQSLYCDEWVRLCATLMAEMMQEYYDVGRWVRILGSDKGDGIRQITEKEKLVKYDLIVEPGSTLPYDEERRLNNMLKAYELVASPVTNPLLPDVLRALEIPNTKKILDGLPAYQKYLQFVQLYEQVKAGQIDPQQAVQMLVQSAMQEFGADGQAAQGNEQGGMVQ